MRMVRFKLILRKSQSRFIVTILATILLVLYVRLYSEDISEIPTIQKATEVQLLNNISTDQGVAVYKDLQLNQFDVTKIKLQFHPALKNPCVLEYVNNDDNWVYRRNQFIANRHYRKRSALGYKLEHSLHILKHGVLVNDSTGLCKPGRECRLRCLPYFMLIGAAKSGTSDFANKALSHPQIFGAVNKELYYWTQFKYTLNATLGDYCDLFDLSLLDLMKVKKTLNGKDFYPRVLSEYTSQTLGDDFFWRDHPKNKGLKEPMHLKIHDIYQVNPKVKIIAILRNPTFKVYSSYNMYRRNMVHTPLDFHERIVASISWWENCTQGLGLPVRTCAYSCVPELPAVLCAFSEDNNNRWGEEVVTHSGEILRALYSVFVRDWLSVFPRHQLLFLRTEDSYNMSNVMVQQVFPFLDLEPVTKQQAPEIFNDQHKNKRKYIPMLPQTQRILDQFYRPFNEDLASLLGDRKWLWES